ncbi:NHL repeat-containing protein [Algoriphagus mannitolivorans]|uniref:PQQ-like beta-propeller repeat protein n=1 Tax=Algoriphagus mannitolivorans TaxID=226504 RepID=UPI000429007C|nr:PQQ-like beta-propeller repeat protein [Algoriphagus mannitolivorans]
MKKLIQWAFFAFILLSQLSNAIAQVDTTRFTNHGAQLFASMIQGSVFAKGPQDRQLIYTVVRGEPAHLLGYDVETRELILDQALPEADGAWDLAQSTDGTIYAPGANGSLFAHIPGTQEVKDLGVVLEGENYLWNLTAGADGEVFGATYPGCRVFRYHPKDGFSDVGKGPLVENQNYVRSLAFYPKTGMLYAGVGSKAHLIELNPITGEKKELLPEKFRNYEFVYGLEIVPGLDGNDRLFALITNGSITLVYNLQTREFEQEIEGMDMRAITGEPSGKTVYLTSKSQLKRFDPSKNYQTAEVLGEEIGTALAFHYGEDGKVYFLTSGANLFVFNPKDNSLSKNKLQIPGQPIPIHSLVTGPDGKIWSGGYLAGGNAAYDPKTGQSTFLPGLDQTEGMSVFGDQIFFGIYPKGKFYVYDTKSAWKPKEGNPKFLGQIENQSRAFTQVVLKDKKQLVFGMIPEYGKLGGALVVYDAQTEELKHFPSPVEKQAIAGLAYTGDYVLVGTTISGGLGIAPETKEAHLVGWNPETGEKLFDIIPVPGASALTGFLNMPDGSIWGMGDGQLFIFDPKARKVKSVTKLFDYPPFKSHIWRSAFMVLHPDGNIYGTDWEKLFKLNPKTLEYTQLAKEAALLVMGEDGTLYFKRKTDLWSYRPSVQ